MNLTATPDVVSFSPKLIVYVEKVGPFMKTARAAWEEVLAQMPNVENQVQVLGTMAIFQMKPELIYRAAIVVDAKPETLPAGTQFMEFAGGKYSKFTLRGSYMQLPSAWGSTMANVEKLKIQTADHFYVENYANSPKVTAEEDLITELMIPTK